MNKQQLYLALGLFFLLVTSSALYSCGKLDGAAIGEAVSIVGDVE